MIVLNKNISQNIGLKEYSFSPLQLSILMWQKPPPVYDVIQKIFYLKWIT
jgi:hypothetical protein